MVDESIICRNLEVMLSEEEGGMINCANDESMGGNAFSHKGYPCVATNFYYQTDNGRMFLFTNDLISREGLSHGTYVIMVDLNRRADFFRGVNPEVFFKIIELIHEKETPESAINILAECAKRYNRIQADNWQKLEVELNRPINKLVRHFKNWWYGF